MNVRFDQRFFAAYSGVLTAILAVVLFSGFDGAETNKKPRLEEITVQRINVVEPDGTLRMVISNKARAPGIYIKGKERLPGHHSRTAGLIFLNDEGTETGGLTFSGLKDENGNEFSTGHLSFDRYLQDQVLTFSAQQVNEQRTARVNMIDQPAWPITDFIDLLDRIANLPPEQQDAEIRKFIASRPQGQLRVTLGREADQSVGLQLKDTAGRNRLILKVEPDGSPRLQFLNAEGQVISELPPR